MHQKLYFGSPIENHWNIIDILDENHRPTNLIAVRSEIKNRQASTCLEKLIHLRRKKIIGLSSYQEFPQKISNPHDQPIYNNQRFIEKYSNQIVLWCHCFRDPKHYLPNNMPRILYSESDQYRHCLHLNSQVGKIPKKYDFFVSMPQGEWNTYIRGFSIAQQWLNHMADVMGLKILVCGTNRRKDFSENIDVIDFQKWCDFIDCMNQCRYLFCSSIYDASPRIIVEAMSLNMPVLLNKNILGGWKYIQEDTGMFFEATDPIEETIQKFMQKEFNPLEFTKRNFNIIENSEMLANQVNKVLNYRIENFIDGIIYINLDHRTDRDIDIRRELKKMDIPNSLVHRVSAVFNDDCGHLGCAKSHVNALELAKEKGWKKFLILEDDFSFKVTKPQFLYTLDSFYEKNDDWGVFMLAACHLKIKDEEKSWFPKVTKATTTSGYLVESNFLDKLLLNFKEAVELLEKDVEEFLEQHPGEKKMTTPFAIDIHWHQLQKQGYFYTSDPMIGGQSKSYSSIMKKKINLE
jgi:GR25 family glycosyltransferase involved in LPS biosynthesis